ncbi:hypothetical protein [Marinomonas flavescens]|uniref:hypothetical protein n=1 Tax=Marinomonas flavescens TaxID=2529379 RepID=UPI0010546C5C|nr:hypothetical protein [Marinomonas flavescens]
MSSVSNLSVSNRQAVRSSKNKYVISLSTTCRVGAISLRGSCFAFVLTRRACETGANKWKNKKRLLPQDQEATFAAE